MSSVPEYKKEFDAWNAIKQRLDTVRPSYFYEREVWWSHVGVNVGVEIDGKGTYFVRPVVVVKKFNKHSFLGLPVTLQNKTGKYHVPIHFENGLQRIVITSQLRLFDSCRLYKKYGTVSAGSFLEMKKAIRDFFEI